MIHIWWYQLKSVTWYPANKNHVYGRTDRQIDGRRDGQMQATTVPLLSERSRSKNRIWLKLPQWHIKELTLLMLVSKYSRRIYIARASLAMVLAPLDERLPVFHAEVFPLILNENMFYVLSNTFSATRGMLKKLRAHELNLSTSQRPYSRKKSPSYE